MKSILLALIFVSSFLLYAKVNMQQEYGQLKDATERRLEQINPKLEHMKILSLELSGKAKVELEEEYDSLVKLKNKLEDQLEDAADVSTEKWNATKERIKLMSAELEARVNRAEKS